MKNLVSKTEYINIKELSQVTNVAYETLKKRCQRNKYVCRLSKATSKGGVSGKRYEILISSLEPELQEKVSFRFNLLAGADRSNYISGAHQSCPVFLNDNRAFFIPDKSKKLALSKFDIVQHWQDFRSNKDKKEADKTFIQAFNHGLISQGLLDVVGCISISSLHRWAKLLKENNNNYTSLVNNYTYKKESDLTTTLSDFEKQEFIKIYYNDSKLNLATAYDILKYRFSKINMPVKSEATFRRFVKYVEENHNDFNILSREGEKALKDNVTSYIRRDLSGWKVGDILVADGNKLDFMVVNPLTGRPCRAIWVAFFDWISGDIAGGEIMLTENTQCISSALRNSIIRLGKIPKIVYMDNGRAFRGSYFTGCKTFADAGLEGVYRSLGIKVVFAKPYSGRSKRIERFFGDFVKSCAPCVASYTGSSIGRQPAHNKRNEKFHKELHKNDKIPTLEQAKLIIEEWLKFYRSKPCKNIEGKTIGEAFNDGRGCGVDIDILDDLMMVESVRTARRCTIKLFGQEYESAALYGKTGKYIVKYSFFDISKIKIYSLKGEYIGVAECVTRIKAMAKENGGTIDLQTYKQELKKQNVQFKKTITKTKQLIGASASFETIDWSNVAQIEDKKKQKTNKNKALDCGLELYYDIHKIQKIM